MHRTKRNKKVVLVSINKICNDVRILTEAKILVDSGLVVVVVVKQGEKEEPLEWYNGFCIKRVKPYPRLANTFKQFFYSFSIPGSFKFLYIVIATLLKFFDRALNERLFFFRLLKTILAEKADYYHAHFTPLLMIGTFLGLKLLRKRFIRDYNDIIVLENKKVENVNYYEQDQLWGEKISASDEVRINATVSIIPEKINSILDIGCGDGAIVNVLDVDFYKIVAVDLSMQALKYVKVKKLSASAINLPFGNRAFDLIISTEMLEHLPKKEYERAISEMKRVAKSCILIGVPWKEQVSISEARCAKCKKNFHLNFHYRRFNKAKLRKMFNVEFELISLQQVGNDKLYYTPWLLWGKKWLGGIWARTEATICPYCKSSLLPFGYPEINLIKIRFDQLNKKIVRMKRDKRHAVALFKRI